MTLEVGAIVSGKVVSITKFGAFIDMDGKTGLVHISEVASGFVKDINDVLKVGDEVKVKVLTINPDGKVSLSIRQAQVQTQVQRNTRNNENRNYDAPKNTAPQSFEEMMKSFTKSSEEKVAEFRRRAEGTHNKKRRS